VPRVANDDIPPKLFAIVCDDVGLDFRLPFLPELDDLRGAELAALRSDLRPYVFKEGIGEPRSKVLDQLVLPIVQPLTL